ncbi:hypothetical protein ABIA31_007071 [Catenulispora sp. MAP5-51]|uniref:caspase family protein n=1 Tax=Catenulispora sp. MAP5-51 TaxID=3156298 RepID=UPI003510FBF8
MSGRALLIGGAVESLTGVENDVAAMAEALSARGLTVEPPLTGKDATRAAILEAYERLIASVAPGEAAVVYYSGHGGRALPPAAGSGSRSGSGPEPMDLQFIVPYDFDESGPDDFRGITSVELSVLLARLTVRTDNAVAIFDCCHSGRISREDRLRVKATSRTTTYGDLSAHIEKMRGQGLRTDLVPATGNPKAVRIVACAPEQLSYEYPGMGGKQIGIMTEALTLALKAAGTERVSWATLLDAVRLRVSSLVSGQRPEAEGPSRRLLFETEGDDRLDSLPVTVVGDGRVRLDCAPLLGVRQGDTFTVLSPAQDTIGDLTVDRVGPFSAQGEVAFAAGITEVPVGARARRITAAAPKLVVSVPPDIPHGAELDRALAASPLLRTAAGDEPWAARLRIDDDGAVTVADRVGALHEPRPSGEAGLAKAVRDLERLARAEALRGLDADTRWSLNASNASNASITCEWGLVQGGERRPLPASGALVEAGRPVYISVRNHGETPVYATLVDIGIAGKISVLTELAPSGVRLARGEQQEYVYGFDDITGVLAGVPLDWPDGLDPVHTRMETVLLFLTSEPQDFSALSQPGIARSAAQSAAAAQASPLSVVLDQIATGRTRDLRGVASSAVRYDVRKVEFELEPAGGTGGFLIEEMPGSQPAGPTARVHTWDGAETPDGAENPSGASGASGPSAPSTMPVPSAVAVRLDELVIHRNRARFGGADVRIDAIVLTGEPHSPRPAFQARTERFSRIRDGEPLPLDRMLVYHGSAAEYLDIALWVSRDRPDAVDLGELLSDEVAAFEMQEALAKMGGAMTGLPYAAAAAAMVGVGAVVVNVAYRLLRGTVSDVIGLYRGSMLAAEGFGVGRHPGQGVRRVQDFSFAYSIDDVS